MQIQVGAFLSIKFSCDLESPFLPGPEREVFRNGDCFYKCAFPL